MHSAHRGGRQTAKEHTQSKTTLWQQTSKRQWQQLTLGADSAPHHGCGAHLGSHGLAGRLHGGWGVVGGAHVPDGAILPAVAQQPGNEGQIRGHLLLAVLQVVQLVYTAWGLHASKEDND